MQTRNYWWASLVLASATILTACGGKGDDTSTGPVVPLPATVTISATPAALTLGASASLTWSTTDATACTASGAWTGTRATSGIESVTPTAAGAAVYTLSCTGLGGNGTASATVTVAAPPAPTVTLAAAPAQLIVGASSTLTWSSSNATACTASGDWSGSRATAGTEAATPAAAGTATYTLTCTGAGGSANASATVQADAPAVITGSVVGRVINTVSGAPVAGAQVSSGSATATSAADGGFTLTAVAIGDRASVRISATGFEDNYRVVPVVRDTATSASVLLLPIGTESTLIPAAGGAVQIPGSSAQVTFPPGVIDSSSPVRVTLTDVNPASSAANMPGDFTSADTGSSNRLESFGALAINMYRADGSRAPLVSGGTASLRIPVSSRSTTPTPTIPLYFYDTAAGLWRQEGTATLVTEGGNSYYIGNVQHFTYWNVDRTYETVIVTGCVAQADGSPAAGVSITGSGIDYTGTSSATSGADGRFTIPVRSNSRVALSGIQGSRITSTLSIATTTSPLDTTANCLQIGDSRGFSLTLTWGQVPTDLDSWLLLPEGGFISYRRTGSLTQAPFANLDIDDTSSFGPEVVTVVRPRVGSYRYFVNNFSRSPAPGITSSPARVELMANGFMQLYTPPAGETAATFNWTVVDILVAANCDISLSTSQTAPWTAAQPVNPVAADPNAPFCTVN